MTLTKEILDQILRYDHETGIFYNRHDRAARARAGQPAGTLSNTGYIRINVNGKLYLAHRLAWLTAYGKFPSQIIDHINGKRSDNRISNLRDVSHAENLQNQFRPCGKNPYLGVSLVNGKWAAASVRFGVSLNLGTFNTAEEARDAYQGAKLLTHAEFHRLAITRRRRNKLAVALIELLNSFPGFDASTDVRADWEKRRADFIN